MKTGYIALLGCLGCLLLPAGCASDSLSEIKDSPSRLSEPVVATVSGEMAMRLDQTRSSGNPNISDGVFPAKGVFTDGSDAYICVTAVEYADGTPIEADILARMRDKKYRSVGNGKFEPATSDDAICFYNEKPVKFRAYYPYHLKKTGNAQKPYAFDDKLYEGLSDLPAMLNSQYPICTGNNKFTTPASYDNGLGWWSKGSNESGKNIMRTYMTEFQDKFTDVLRTAEVEASVKDPNIRFIGEKSFQHRMAKINVVIDASWNEFHVDDSGMPNFKYGMYDVRIFPHKSLCAYSPADDTFSFPSSGITGVGMNEEISMRETNYYGLSKLFQDVDDDLWFIADDYKTPQILIAPQTVDVYFKFDIRGPAGNLNVSTNPLTGFVFEKGKEYTFTVTVNLDRAIISGCTISDWNTGIESANNMDAF